MLWIGASGAVWTIVGGVAFELMQIATGRPIGVRMFALLCAIVTAAELLACALFTFLIFRLASMGWDRVSDELKFATSAFVYFVPGLLAAYAVFWLSGSSVRTPG